MSEVKYISEPWEIAQIDTRRVYQDEHLVEAVAAIRIGKFSHKLQITGRTTEQEFLAMIRLIAAAPDLLNALQSMYETVAEQDKVIWDCARNAIAKATAA